jgi:hypothetical protein
VRCSARQEKARIRAFFLSRSALSLFFALFFLRALALFFSFALASAKARKKRECPALQLGTIYHLLTKDRFRFPFTANKRKLAVSAFCL